MKSGRAGWQLALAVVVSGQCTVVPAVRALEPAHLRAGPFYFAPAVDAEVRYIDNLLRSEDDPLETWGTMLKPRLQTWLQDGFNTYSLTYELIESTYFDSSDDDATDHRLDLDIHLDFNASNALKLAGKYYKMHEERGTGLTEGDLALTVDKPVKFDYVNLGGEYTLGNRHSTGRLEVAAALENLEYQNFHEFTTFRDRDTANLRGTFYYRAGARSLALVEARLIDQDYQNSYVDDAGTVTNLDSIETILVAGITWEATAKTSGEIKIGGYSRDFQDSAQVDESGFHWEATLRWNPRSYSTVELMTRRVSRETHGEGDFVDIAEYQAQWKHAWNQRIASHLRFRYAREGYIGSARNDDLYRAGAGIEYNLRRWLDLEIGYRFEKRSSNAEDISYDRNIFFLGVKMSL